MVQIRYFRRDFHLIVCTAMSQGNVDDTRDEYGRSTLFTVPFSVSYEAFITLSIKIGVNTLSHDK